VIIIDTNIISELMKPNPDNLVIKWFGQQQTLQLYITTITIAEISYGLDVLVTGKRRQLLEETFNKVITEAFQHRIFSFDKPAAYLYGKIMGQRKKSGRPMSIADGQIAAIARSQGSAIATRNVTDFINCGVEIFNPFSDEASS